MSSQLSLSPYGAGPYHVYQDPFLNDLIPIALDWNIFEIEIEDEDGTVTDIQYFVQFDNKSVPVRRAINKAGQEIVVQVNSFQAVFKPAENVHIHQYDVKIYLLKDMSDPDKKEADIPRKVKEKLWASRPIRHALGQYSLYDGEKIAWYVSYTP